MEINLTKLQKKHFDSIKWLFDEKRAEGKTYLLAIIFIQKALRTGMWVRPMDHFTEGGERANMLLMDLIKSLIGEIISKKSLVEFRRNEFRIK